MKIISIKLGNKGLSFTLFNMEDEQIITSGVFERIGMANSYYTITYKGEKITEEVALSDCVDVAKTLLDKLISLEFISHVEDIKGIGYFVFYGKDQFYKSSLLKEEDIQKLDTFRDFAPNFMQDNISGIKAFQEVFNGIPIVGVFDTAFYGSLAEDVYLYPVPRSWYVEYGVRKYGYYGIAHNYVASCIGALLNRESVKLISCYLGNEHVSISAISNGKCIDTSMGFSLTSGAIMGTSCGDIDPTIIPYIMEKEGKNASEILDDLNYNSGLLGLSEITNDTTTMISLCEEGSKQAILAKNKYVRRIVDHIAQYYVLLGGIDVISFTGDVGEKQIPIRREICEKLYSLGIKINLDINSTCRGITKISSNDSSAMVYVIPGNDELMIARETLKVLSDRKM